MPGPLPPAVDLELAGNCWSRAGSDTVRRELTACLTDVERWAGRPVVLYVGASI
jgi:lysozyme